MCATLRSEGYVMKEVNNKTNKYNSVASHEVVSQHAKMPASCGKLAPPDTESPL